MTTIACGSTPKTIPAPSSRILASTTPSRLCGKLLGEFRDRDDKLLKLQYIQYEWVRYCVELYRRHKWFSSGALFWMFNDCCRPTAGHWWIITACLRRAITALKNTCQPVAASIAAAEGGFAVYVLNDLPETVEGETRLYVQGDDRADAAVGKDDFLQGGG